MASLQLLRQVTRGTPCLRSRGVSSSTTHAKAILSSPKHSLATMAVRKFHTQSVLQSMKTRMRPETKQNKGWLAGLERNSPEFNKRLGEDMQWWIDMNTDKMGKFLEHDLQHGAHVRWGIVQKFMLKSYKPQHLHTIFRCLSWLQARWKQEFRVSTTVPLCKAVYRARAPDLGLRILNSPWLRILNNANSSAWLLRTCVELAEESLYASPSYINYQPYPNESPVDDFVDPHAVEEEETTAISAARGRHAARDEPEETKAKDAKDWSSREFNLDTTWDRVVAFVWDSKHGFRMEPRLYAHQAEFYAAKGQVEKAQDLLNTALSMPPAPTKEFVKSNGQVVRTEPLCTKDIMPTAYLASGQYQLALDTIRQNNPEGTPLSLRTRRIQIAALLGLGKHEEVITAYKEAGEALINKHELTQTHLGQVERVEKVREIYAALKEDGINITPEIEEYLSKLDTAIPANNA